MPQPLADRFPKIFRLVRRALGGPIEVGLESLREPLDRIAARDLSATPDAELAARMAVLGARARGGADLGELETEAISLTIAASRRALGLAPHPNQLAAGLAMARGRIAELPTGEGKTLAAVFPAALLALTGHGVHVLTFNDYLARRDAAWMGPVYRLLGLSVGCVQEGLPPAAKRAAYGCDVTYATAKEAGFDFLRDGLAYDLAGRVHRPFHAALVDEADSILIDEARVPLVIAELDEGSGPDVSRLAGCVAALDPLGDLETDAEHRNVFLTGRGIRRVEAALGCGNLYAAENQALLQAVSCALHARVLRAPGRGLHRAGRPDRDRRRVHRPGDGPAPLAGRAAGRGRGQGRAGPPRSGAHPRLDRPAALPPALPPPGGDDGHRPLLGRGAARGLRPGRHRAPAARAQPPRRPARCGLHPPGSQAARPAAEIGAVHATARPILVGTPSVQESESLAAALQEAGVPCQVLNARNDEQEAAIIAEAGRPGAVTISTNMAGRGTDIRLGGADEAERDAVAALGGLYVIGTSRHESRRIDLQLRGRAGRQGDPGSTRFFISLEDDLFTRYGLTGLFATRHRLARQEGDASDPSLRRAIAHAQRVVEGQNGDIRSSLYRYSSLLDRQRRLVQQRRDELVFGTDPPGLLAAAAPELAARGVARFGTARLAELERRVLLRCIDRAWSEHLAWLNTTQESIHLVSLAGRSPIQEFEKTAWQAWWRFVPGDGLQPGKEASFLGPGP